MGLLSAKVIYWAAAGAYRCFPLFFLCAYLEQVVFLLKNSDYCKRKKLDILRCTHQSKSKGKPRAF